MSSSVSAQVELSVQVGFENRTTPGRYAPIRIAISHFRDYGAARLRIVQVVGNEWRGEATIRQELGYAIQSDGLYEAVIPTYDPVNPVVIELVSSTGDILASEEIDLRATMRSNTFPVLDRRIARFDDRAAVIDVASLPTQWWAFDSAESLWIASPLASDIWTAVSQWVLAGGSLVVLTGADFYRMDSPELRNLLPLSQPTLVVSDLGTTYLTGSHGEAAVGMVSEEGFPLLLRSAHGAGSVSLVTVQAQSLSIGTLENIRMAVPSSQRISLQGSTDYILGEQTVATLDSLFVLALIALLAAVSCLSALIGKRNARAGWGVVLVCVAGLSVSSGLISNPVTLTVDLYSVNTQLLIDAGYGLSAVYSSFFSQTSVPLAQLHETEIVPIESLPRTLKGTTSYDLSTFSGKTEFMIPPGETRQWLAYGRTPARCDLALLSDGRVRIGNHLPLDFHLAWIVIDGDVFVVDSVRQGVDDYDLGSQVPVRLNALFGSSLSQEMMPAATLIRELQGVFPLAKGAWLLALSDTERLHVGEITEKVRDISLIVVQGKESVREI